MPTTLPTGFRPLPTTLPTACFQPPIPPGGWKRPSRAFHPCSDRLRWRSARSNHSRDIGDDRHGGGSVDDHQRRKEPRERVKARGTRGCGKDLVRCCDELTGNRSLPIRSALLERRNDKGSHALQARRSGINALAFATNRYLTASTTAIADTMQTRRRPACQKTAKQALSCRRLHDGKSREGIYARNLAATFTVYLLEDTRAPGSGETREAGEMYRIDGQIDRGTGGWQAIPGAAVIIDLLALFRGPFQKTCCHSATRSAFKILAAPVLKISEPRRCLS
jgi:hypothetical protein